MYILFTCAAQARAVRSNTGGSSALDRFSRPGDATSSVHAVALEHTRRRTVAVEVALLSEGFMRETEPNLRAAGRGVGWTNFSPRSFRRK